MLGIISGYLLPERSYLLESAQHIETTLKNFTVSVVTGVANYLFPPSGQRICQTPGCTMTMNTHHLAGECTPFMKPPWDELLPDSDGFYWVNNVSEHHEDGDSEYSYSSQYSIQPDSGHHSLPFLWEPEDSGPMALPYLNLSDIALAVTDDPYPNGSTIACDAPVSIPPKSLHCFDTASMFYIPGEFEILDINAVDIITGSELAQQLGISGKVPVDKVFYEAGSGAIIAQITLDGEAYSFTLFFIEIVNNIQFSAAEQLENKEFLQAHKQNPTMTHSAFRRCQNRHSRVIGQRKSTKPSGEITKHYRCNSDIGAVTNKRGNNITEAIKIRMYQEEERLAPNPERVRFNNIAAQLEAVAKRKKDWLATQRNAARLNIIFADNYRGNRYRNNSL